MDMDEEEGNQFKSRDSLGHDDVVSVRLLSVVSLKMSDKEKVTGKKEGGKGSNLIIPLFSSGLMHMR